MHRWILMPTGVQGMRNECVPSRDGYPEARKVDLCGDCRFAELHRSGSYEGQPSWSQEPFC